ADDGARLTRAAVPHADRARRQLDVKVVEVGHCLTPLRSAHGCDGPPFVEKAAGIQHAVDHSGAGACILVAPAGLLEPANVTRRDRWLRRGAPGHLPGRTLRRTGRG